MKPVSVIGMGLSPRDLTETHLKQIRQADILIGGKRLLQFFEDYQVIKKEIKGNIKDIIQYIKDKMEKDTIVVLASGDPLFFGIGSLLVNAIGAENVSIYPNISSVSAAFSRIRESWSDAHVISMHGRNDDAVFFHALSEKNKIAVFTDPVRNPAWLANTLLENEITDFRLCVLEQLGTPSERVGWYDPAQAADMQFSEPNILILKRISSQSEEKKNLCFGMPDQSFEHQKGLITKAEVRAVTLSKLCLMPGHIVWDLGAGSGSVSIEAALFVKHGKIFAVEQRADRRELIRTNQKRFGVKNLEIIEAVLPKGLKDLPRPDRIFIGGGGRDLEKIIEVVSSCLMNHGIIVINTVLLSNIETALSTLRRIGFKTDIVQIQISRGQDMPWSERLEAQNPVWIISGLKNGENED
ncbi:precorrin-6y C5,15-methyltransferase (decarboxylating) subunit CbiE [Desulfonema magnum]|nr:precorrin-6y C5,15-methyltransferase (decarboxylating) subunit CbiE [Desulfonema magnum]